MKSPPETSLVPDEDNKYEMAFKEVIRVMESAVLAGEESIGLEWQGDDLLVFYAGDGHAATNIPKRLQLEVIAEIVKRAHIGRKHKGNIRLPLHGQEYSVAVEEYDRFGESAYTLTLRKSGKSVE